MVIRVQEVETHETFMKTEYKLSDASQKRLDVSRQSTGLGHGRL